MIVAIGVGAYILLSKTGTTLISKLQESMDLSGVPSGSTPTPTPSTLLQGTETYQISQSGLPNEPHFSTLIVDPHEPKRGKKQTLSATITSPSSLQSVKFVVITDNKSIELPATLASGTVTSGVWTTTWTVDDTLLYKYIVRIIATNQAEFTAMSTTPIRSTVEQSTK